MKLVIRLFIAVILTMAAAPVIGVASNPIPDCFPWCY